MPILGILHTVVGLIFAIHALRTGRPQYWALIIMMVPLLGTAAYIIMEILPDAAQSRRGRQVQSTISDVVAPDREFHRRREAAMAIDSVDAKRALAEECGRKGMWSEALDLYRACHTGAFQYDPVISVGLARALLETGQPQDALATLDDLQAAHDQLDSSEGHLLYARALEALGRFPEAVAEYERVCGYYTGLEARTRFALLLLRLGEPNRAQALFSDVMRAGKSRGAVLTEADRKWLKVARANA